MRAVAFIIFDRPELTKHVFEKIRSGEVCHLINSSGFGFLHSAGDPEFVNLVSEARSYDDGVSGDHRTTSMTKVVRLLVVPGTA